MPVPSFLLSATRASFPVFPPSSETLFYWEAPARGQVVSKAVLGLSPMGTQAPSDPFLAGNAKVGIGQEEQFSGLGRHWALGVKCDLAKAETWQGIVCCRDPQIQHLALPPGVGECPDMGHVCWSR